MGIVLYYCFALIGGVSLGSLLAIAAEPLIDQVHRKPIKTRWVIWGCIVAVAASIVFIGGVASLMGPSGPGAMPGVGFAILVTAILPMSVIGAATLGAVVLFLRVPPRAVSITIIVASAIAWGVSDVYSWLPLDMLVQTLSGRRLVGRFGIVGPDTRFGFHTIFAAILMGTAAILVNRVLHRKVEDSNTAGKEVTDFAICDFQNKDSFQRNICPERLMNECESRNESERYSTRMVAVFALSFIGLLSSIGGLKLAALALFQFEFHSQPIEVVGIPLGIAALVLNRKSCKTSSALHRFAALFAWIAIAIPLLFGMLLWVNLKFLSGGFP